jgi:coenzyme F420-reducing hydrogenase beta subunit
MTVILGHIMPPGVAAMAALLSRVWITAAEVLCAGVAMLVAQRFGMNRPATAAREAVGPDSTAEKDLTNVLKADLCIACGACVAADPSLELTLHPQKLMYEPSGIGNAAAASVCPAVRVDFKGLHDRIFPGAPSGPLGVVDSVLLAQSTDEPRNLRSSSGGLVKEMLIALLSREDVDGAIVLNQVEGLLFKPQLITRAEEVDRLPGSIYHNVPFDDALRLLSRKDGRFVLVANPCQLEGIWSYIYRFRPELAARIHTTIGLACGWTYSHHAVKAICEYKGIDFSKIDDISFRGGGPVGRLRIEAAGKQVAIHRRVDYSYQVAFDRSFNLPRCHYCVDHGNYLAEAVVADAWLPSTVRTKTGISLVIARTGKIAALLEDLRAKGKIQTTIVSEAEVIESQTHRVAFGDFAYAYMDYVRDIGGYVPDMVGPNRQGARLVSRRAVAGFHRETERKIALQRQGRYRFLRWRKITVEFRSFFCRYLRWFFVRVLSVKSLLGLRKEVSKSKLAGFR